MFIPYRVDVPMRRWPIANFVIIGLTIVAFFWQQTLSDDQLQGLVLNGWNLKGLFGHMWLHGDVIHLLGNMLFLWVFGNAVCAKVGNIVYPLLYLAGDLAATFLHLVFDGGPAIGASGAINGIVGAYLVLYPLNNVSCLLWLGVRPWLFTLSGYWIILLFLGFDIWGAYRGVGNIGHYAHLGGFAGGFGLMVLALLIRALRMDDTEKSLLQVFGMHRLSTERERLVAAGPPPERWAAGSEEPRGPETTLERMRASRPAERSGAPVPPAPGSDIPRPPSQAQAPTPAPQTDAVLMRCICGKRLRVPRSLSGRQAKCPACAQVIQIPDV